MSLSLIITAAGIGIMATPHCVAMCACGLARSYFNPSQDTLNKITSNSRLTASNQHLNPRIFFAKSFLSKRLVSYTIGGAIVGGASQTLSQWIWPFIPMAHSFAMMLHLGLAGMALFWLLQSTGIWHTPERAQGTLGNTQTIKVEFNKSNMPFSMRFNNTAQSHIPLLWGWLPCNALYSAYALAYLTGDWLSGAILMLSFGFTSSMALIAQNRLFNWVASILFVKLLKKCSLKIQCFPFIQAIVLFLGLVIHWFFYLGWFTMPTWLIPFEIC